MHCACVWQRKIEEGDAHWELWAELEDKGSLCKGETCEAKGKDLARSFPLFLSELEWNPEP